MRVQHTALGVMTLAGLVCVIFLTTCLAHDSPDKRLRGANAAAESQRAAQTAQDAQELAPGAPGGGELAEGETHTYRIKLAAGQYLRVVVGKNSINVALTLIGPDGLQLNKMEGLNSSREPRALLAVIERDGEHRLLVSAAGKEVPGRYTLQIEELRNATARDSDRVSAEKVYIEGERLRAQQTAESLKAAIGKFDEALIQLRAVGDRNKEAETLDNIGWTYSELGTRPKALEYFQLSLPIHRDMGNRGAEAAALYAIGFQHQWMGDRRKALEHYNLALAIHREMGDRNGQAVTLNRLGMVYSGLGDRQKAIEFYRQSLSLWRELKTPAGEAQTLNNIGYAYWLLNEHQKALEHYEQSLTIKRQIEDHAGEANTLTSIGDVYTSWGEHQKALERHEQALLLNRRSNYRHGEMVTLSNMGQTYSSLGEYQKALDCFHRALPLARQGGSPLQEAYIHGGIGWVYWLLGQPQKALEHYNQALLQAQAVNARPEEAYTLHLIGMAQLTLGEYQKAFDFYNRGLSISRDLQPRTQAARSLNGLGWAYWAVGQSQKALDHFDQSLPLWRAAGDKLAVADTLDYIGLAYSSLGQPQKALEHHRQALPLREAIDDRIERRYTLLGMARAERSLGNFAEARAHIEEALAVVESLRAKVVTQDMRSSFFAVNRGFYESYIDLLMAMHTRGPAEGYDAAALEVSERARARSLLDSLIEARADIRQGVDPHLLADERSIGQRLNAKEAYRIRLLSGHHTPEQAATTENELKDLLAQYQNVQARIRAASPRYAALAQPATLNLKEIQRQALDDDTLLLEYALGQERSFLWAVTRNSISSFELPGRASIETAAQRVYELLNVGHLRQRKRESELAAAELSRMLLGPVVSQLEKKRLLIVADGALQYLPFAALPAPENGRAEERETRSQGYKEKRRKGEKVNPQSVIRDPQPAIRNPQSFTPLIVNHEIINLPSASTLAELRRDLASRQPAARTVAVLADPVLQADDARVKRSGAVTKIETTAAPVVNGSETDDPVRSAAEAGAPSLERLPFTRQEAEAILALARDGKSLKALDFNASRATATSPELAEYRIVHFATHGFINNRRPQLSGVVLSLVNENGLPQDGFLRTHDIYNLRLGADLVVLSACQTALGKQVKGEGLVGLVRGFMYAGAPRVAASLWNVKDEATAELMKRFYEKMLKEGMTPAAALRAAQVSMWKDKRWEAPYFWAGFILQGEWR